MVKILGTHNVDVIGSITIDEFLGKIHCYDKEVEDFLRAYAQDIFNYYGEEITEKIREHTNKNGYDDGYPDRVHPQIEANLKRCHDDLFDIVNEYQREIKQGLNPFLCIPYQYESEAPAPKNRIAKFINKNQDRTQHTYKIFSGGREHYCICHPILGGYGKEGDKQFNGDVIAIVKFGYPFSKEEEKANLEEAADAIIKAQNDTELKKHTNEYISAFCHIPGGKDVFKNKLQNKLNEIKAFNEEERKNNSKSIEDVRNIIGMYNKIVDKDDLISLNRSKPVVDEETLCR